MKQNVPFALMLVITLLVACTPPATPLARTAILREVLNVVMARTAAQAEFVPVSEGYVLTTGGQITTDENARAKLVLNDGIIIRLASATSLTNDSSFTQWKFKLEHGKIWVSLFGGILDAETLLGAITIFGNSVTFEYLLGDPAMTADDTLIIQCLQGTCTFRNQATKIVLGDLEQLVVTHNGQTVSRSSLSADQVNEFILNNPETAGILAGLKGIAPKITGTAVQVKVPTLPFFVPASSSPIPSPTRTSTPTATPRSATNPPGSIATHTPAPPQPTQTSGPSQPGNTAAPVPPIVQPTPTFTAVPPTLTPLPTETPIPTRTPPPTKTPIPTDTLTLPPILPTDTDTPTLPADTPTPPADTPTPPAETPTP